MCVGDDFSSEDISHLNGTVAKCKIIKDNQKVSVLKYCDNMVSICSLCFLSRFMFG